MDVILYAEDEETDVALVKLAFSKAQLANDLQVIADGQQAIDYLAGQGQYSDRETYPLPRLILLDLNLPLVHGLEVLQWIQKQPCLLNIPVVVFSSSAQASDMERAKKLGAQGYLVKPASFDKLVEIVKSFRYRWLLEREPVTVDASGY